MSTDQKNGQEKTNQKKESEDLGGIFNHTMNMMKQMSKCCFDIEQKSDCSEMMKNMMDKYCGSKTDDTEKSV